MNIIVALLIAVAAGIYSENSKADEKPSMAEIAKMCEDYKSAAAFVMRERQKGTTMTEMLAHANGSARGEKLIMLAYKEPAVRATSVQQMFVDRFADEAWVRCMKYYEKNGN